MTDVCVDLNCDMGEEVGDDAAILPYVTSANIACGAHAGSPATMRRTVRAALAHGVAIGAHPGFADRANFGRVALPLTPDEAYALVRHQVEALDACARAEGATMTHVKPHGALYNMAAVDAALASAIARAVRAVDPALVLVGLSGSELVRAAEREGLAAASEVFADRTYQPDGTLTPRTRPDALVTSVDAAVAQALAFVRDGYVRATDGTLVPVRAGTICLHGDGPHAVAFARAIREGLAAAGVTVAPLARRA